MHVLVVLSLTMRKNGRSFFFASGATQSKIKKLQNKREKKKREKLIFNHFNGTSTQGPFPQTLKVVPLLSSLCHDASCLQFCNHKVQFLNRSKSELNSKLCCYFAKMLTSCQLCADLSTASLSSASDPNFSSILFHSFL